MGPTKSYTRKPSLAKQQDTQRGTVCEGDRRCPDLEEQGCKRVQALTPLPKKQLALLLSVLFAEPLTAHVMLPFIVQLIEETGVTGGDIKKAGYYTGMIDSLFFCSEALMILQWGRLSDRIGRRPVLLTGLFGLGLSMICFGLSHTFWTLVVSRVGAGLLNGNMGVAQCVISEITDETNVAQAFATIPLAWYAGNTVAPLLGGLLQHPYERLGGVFRHSKFWHRHPYFLPCALVASISASCFVLVYLFLKETAPCKIKSTNATAQKSRVPNSADESTTATENSQLIPSRKPSPPSLRSLATPRVIVVTINYAILALVEISFCVLQPLCYSTPIKDGGLGLSPSVIGACMSVYGIANATISTLFFAPLTRKFGKKRLTTTCVFGFFGCFALFPFMNGLARIEGRVTPSVWAAFALQLSLGTLHPMAFSCILIYIRSSAPSPSTLGATTGLASTSASIMRAVGPEIATSLFAVSKERNLLGGGLVYVVMSGLAAAATLATLLLPSKPWEKVESH